MSPKSKLLLSFLAVLAGLALIASGIWAIKVRSPQVNQPFSAVSAEPIPVDPALAGTNELVIPDLGISAPIVSAPVSSDGAMSIPSDPVQVGLADNGSGLDAVSGTTVLAGHVNMAGQRGSLWDLGQVSAGTVAVTFDSASNRTDWAVDSLSTAPKSQVGEAVGSLDGDRRLVVLTCGGEVLNGEYPLNIIVTAHLVAA